jgi:hypothetical protein
MGERGKSQPDKEVKCYLGHGGKDKNKWPF